MEAYFDAKARLFTEVAKEAPAIVPLTDDAVARLRAARPDSTTWSATDASGAALRVQGATLDARGIRGALVDASGRASFASPLIGAYNLENLVVAAGLARAIGISLDDVARGLASAVAPPGRLERVLSTSHEHEHEPLVVVDYAHTPDALERALHTMRAVTPGKLFVVFGAGGDRDPGKRPIMGRIAAEIADAVVVTDDNPRSEDGDSIARAIAAGIDETKRKKRVAAAHIEVGSYGIERARRFAIRGAVDAARHAGSDPAKNAVLVAGKGHERTQTTGPRIVPFHDVAEARRALEDKNAPAFVDGKLVVAALKSRNARVVGALPQSFVGVSTDSRAVEPGSLFVALAGERFDAHDFVEASVQPGKAAAALVSREVKNAANLVVVDDTLAALQDIARAYLGTLKGRRVALTGSNGKTTTKELIAACLRAAFGRAYVVATEGNLNNHIGVPLTALQCEPEHRALIFEMGMNHAREIATLADIVHPEVGLVTNIGTAHQGNFADGVEGVAKAKAELFEALPKDGVAVVNADDPRCIREAQRAAKCKHVSFGWASWADVRLDHVVDRETGGQDITLVHANETVDVALPLEGRHNAQNAAGAVAVGVALGLDFATCARGLADVHRAHGRLERFVLDGDVWLLDDTYNANPDSMEAALNALVELAGKRRMLIVLGEMRELGQFAETEHKHVGAGAGASGAHTIFACGALGKHYGEGVANATRAPASSSGAVSPHFVWTETNAELANLVVDALHDGDVVLVKGSRGARMEVVVDALMKARPRRGR
jgi:murE/murF fusion protein